MEKAVKVVRVESSELGNQRELHNQELHELDFNSQLEGFTDF